MVVPGSGAASRELVDGHLQDGHAIPTTSGRERRRRSLGAGLPRQPRLHPHHHKVLEAVEALVDYETPQGSKSPLADYLRHLLDWTSEKDLGQRELMSVHDAWTRLIYLQREVLKGIIAEREERRAS